MYSLSLWAWRLCLNGEEAQVLPNLHGTSPPLILTSAPAPVPSCPLSVPRSGVRVVFVVARRHFGHHVRRRPPVAPSVGRCSHVDDVGGLLAAPNLAGFLSIFPHSPLNTRAGSILTPKN